MSRSQAAKVDARAVLDVERIRADFPVLSRRVHGHPLAYLDNAATSQKPQAVINSLDRYYREYNANIHRGVHTLSEEATAAYEDARRRIAAFINAGDAKQIIFVRGTTEAINLVAQSWGRGRLRNGDEIVISGLEHHSNIVPWQMLCEQTGATLRVMPITDAGEIDLDAGRKLIGPATRLVAVGHISNALGTINPVAEIVRLAKEHGALTLVDGAQAVPHMAVDVQALGCDFYAFSGHKLFGPTGIGILYGRYDLLEKMPPFQGGGDMIRTVTFEKTTYQDPPHRFEAGTPAIAEVVGLGATLDWLQNVGLARIAAHEHALLKYGTKRLTEIPGLKLIGTAPGKGAILSFTLEGIHPHDIGSVLDMEGIAIRAGHHCAQPTMARFGVPATARASLGPYNTEADLDALAAGIRKIQTLFN